MSFVEHYLLMPQEPLRIANDSQLGSKTSLTFDDLFEVARQFDVSAEALRKGFLSTGRYAEYLGITRREAMRQVEQEVPDDAEVEITHP